MFMVTLRHLLLYVSQSSMSMWMRIIFLGDIVGYGANPNECIELLQTLTAMRCGQS